MLLAKIDDSAQYLLLWINVLPDYSASIRLALKDLAGLSPHNVCAAIAICSDVYHILTKLHTLFLRELVLEPRANNPILLTFS